MNEIRSKSLRNVITIIGKRRNQYGNCENAKEVLEVLADTSYKDIMEWLNCSKRTAYDYKNLLLYLKLRIAPEKWELGDLYKEF